MDVEVTIKVKINNLCSAEDLDEDMTLQDVVEYIIKEEGLYGIADLDDIKIVEIKIVQYEGFI